MKHNTRVITLLTLLFLISQIIGLFVINNYIDKEKTVETGETEWRNLPALGNVQIERPELEEETSYIPLIIGILIATGFILLIIKLKVLKLWRIWFFFGVFFTLLIAFGSFLHAYIAAAIAIILAILKIFKPNVITQNISELFIYGGLASIFVPVLGLLSISILLILISIYDMIAVWKTKHMVKLAKVQAKAKLFAGLLVPYSKNKTAILGGGDIGFPLLFLGVILKNNDLITAFIAALIVSLSLALLFIFGKKNKFYPAMPYLTAGCFASYLIISLL